MREECWVERKGSSADGEVGAPSEVVVEEGVSWRMELKASHTCDEGCEMLASMSCATSARPRLTHACTRSMKQRIERRRRAAPASCIVVIGAAEVADLAFAYASLSRPPPRVEYRIRPGSSSLSSSIVYDHSALRSRCNSKNALIAQSAWPLARKASTTVSRTRPRCCGMYSAVVASMRSTTSGRP